MNTISQQASVAPDEATLKRSIQMKMFASKTDHAEMALAQSKLPAGQFVPAKPIGQVIGIIYAVKEKEGVLPDGEVKMSLLAIGDFEAIAYGQDEAIQSTAAYLPGYFLEAAQALLDRSPSGIEFAIEVLLEPTGKSIPTAYVVRPLIKRAADSPINRIKQALASAGRLRLPPPVDQLQIEGAITEVPSDERREIIDAEHVDVTDQVKADAAAALAPKGKGKAA